MIICEPCRQGWFWRSVRVSNSSYWENVSSSFFGDSSFSFVFYSFNIITDQVCLQETGEEENQEEERRDDGDHGEADPAEDQLEIRRQPRLRLRDEGRALPR